MKLEERTFIPIYEVATYFNTTKRSLCDWLFKKKLNLYARNDLTEDQDIRLLAGEAHWDLLTGIESKVTARFRYRHKYRVYVKHSQGEQHIRLKDLYLKSRDVIRHEKQIQTEVGGWSGKFSGVSVLRKPSHQTKPRWSNNHDDFISKANNLLKSEPHTYTKIVKGHRVPHIGKLAKKLGYDNNQDETIGKGKYGWTVRTIQDVLGERKSDLRVPKIK